MVSKRDGFILLSVVLVFTVLLLINLASSVGVVNSPGNTTNYTTTVFFNATFLNGTDMNVSGSNWTSINLTIYITNGTTIARLGNLSTCGVTSGVSGNVSCYGNLSITSANDGIYNITASFMNGSNQVNSTLANTTNIRFDSSPPAVQAANFTALTDRQNKSGLLSLNVSIIDAGVGVQTVYFNITNGTSGTLNFTANNFGNNWNATINTSTFADGIYNITVRVNDTLNNLNNSATILNVIFDNTAPGVNSANITSVGTGHNITGTFIFNFSVSDANSSIGAVMLNITNSTGIQNSTVFADFETGNIWVASVATTGYRDGTYNVTVVVNDTAGNQNSSVILTNVVFDNSAPSVSLSCTPNPVEQGSSITCTCSGSDAHSGIRSTGTASTTDTASSGPHTTTCSSSNMVNVSASGSFDYTVSGGSGGSGGSSGSGSSGTTGAGASTGKVQRTFDSISAGDSKTISGLDSSYGIKSLEITVNNKVQDVKVTINKFNDKPSGAVTKGGKVYKYLEISATNVDGKISSATINTVVSKKWVADNQLTKDKVALFRLVNSAWVELPTTITEEGDNYVLASISPGFSFFSIAEKVTPAKDAEAVAKDTAVATPEVVKSSNSMKWIIGIVVLLVIVLVVFLVKKKVTSGKK
ncbi:MAG: PGF-pre-PGF domain-containing protein [Nanoarchaeota archaeon]|nr:PGF-pre-PGF domain-containing protein [Nanoarchaeota archaeon]